MEHASTAGRHVLLSGIVGSTAYGLSGPDSDVDRLGIFTYDTPRLFGLKDPPESHVTTGPDVTHHETRKACRLLLGCNPTLTEILWLPDDLYEVRTPLGDRLVEIRKAFLTAKAVRNAYMGYADQQFQKLKNRGDGSFSSDTRKRTAKHARHLMRLVSQGYGLYATGSLGVRLEDPQRHLDFGRQVAAGDIEAVEMLLTAAKMMFDDTVSPLPDRPDEDAVEAWLSAVRYYYFA